MARQGRRKPGRGGDSETAAKSCEPARPAGGITAGDMHGAGARTPKDAGPSYKSASASGRNDVLGRRALLALRDVEGDLLTLEQLTEALGGDVRVVGEHVSAATVL